MRRLMSPEALKAASQHGLLRSPAGSGNAGAAIARTPSGQAAAVTQPERLAALQQLLTAFMEEAISHMAGGPHSGLLQAPPFQLYKVPSTSHVAAVIWLVVDVTWPLLLHSFASFHMLTIHDLKHCMPININGTEAVTQPERRAALQQLLPTSMEEAISHMTGGPLSSLVHMSGPPSGGCQICCMGVQHCLLGSQHHSGSWSSSANTPDFQHFAGPPIHSPPPPHPPQPPSLSLYHNMLEVNCTDALHW